MRTVRLADGSAASRLGFGASRLHHIRSSRERQALLRAALDCGFTHFDAAPSYGDGLAERELGGLRAARGDTFTLVSKFGLSPHPWIDAAPAFAVPLAAARALWRRAGGAGDVRPPIDIPLLRRSLEGSLRRLRCERIDILLLHEPTVERVVDPEALAAALHDLRADGKIGGWGLAGGWAAISAVAARCPALAPLLQTGEREWRDDAPRRPDIVYGAISARPQSFRTPRIETTSAQRNVADALHRRPHGVVLVSTTRVEHLKALAAL